MSTSRVSENAIWHTIERRLSHIHVMSIHMSENANSHDGEQALTHGIYASATICMSENAVTHDRAQSLTHEFRDACMHFIFTHDVARTLNCVGWMCARSRATLFPASVEAV